MGVKGVFECERKSRSDVPRRTMLKAGSKAASLPCYCCLKTCGIAATKAHGGGG